MRRLFAIFLLILLPLQAIWVAAAPYCGHEPSTVAEHVGHHAHEHDSAQATPDTDGRAPAGALDIDCHSCHGFGGAMVLEPGAIGVAPSQPGYPQGIARQSLQPPMPRPERPRWQPLA